MKSLTIKKKLKKQRNYSMELEDRTFSNYLDSINPNYFEGEKDKQDSKKNWKFLTLLNWNAKN